MQSIRNVERLNALELDKVVPPNASWHTDYRDTAYIYIGGLPFELSEGDILTIFSQYGNPVHVHLARDKETGKSRGFAFLKYEDQRSCDLAVDNLSGASVLGRLVSVDHTRYKLKEGEVEGAGMDEEEEGDGGVETDREGEGRRKRRRRTESESSGGEARPVLREEVELERLRREMEDGDPMKGYLVKEEEEEVALALEAVGRRREKEKERHRHKHRSRKDELDEDGEGREKRRRHRSRREESEDGEKDRRPRRSKREGSEEDRRADRRKGHGSSKREREYNDDRDRPRERSPTTSDEEVGGRARGHGRR
ncbi:RNA-binding protein [Teratosphaeria destructans]|uniref:RNA-binding protein n=1 Tax=Teratosphaeria destructans TaxID=418781 RepID=A0A9W7ST77_9PEZI|nr:RNA-binding protein [Teratosphaeria destructans]